MGPFFDLKFELGVDMGWQYLGVRMNIWDRLKNAYDVFRDKEDQHTCAERPTLQGVVVGVRVGVSVYIRGRVAIGHEGYGGAT